MNTKSRTPVLIVGAGPVGLTMAAELARYQIPVRIIDKSSARTDKSKAVTLWSRSLELLDRAGSADDFISAGLRLHASNFIADGKHLARVDFDGVQSPYAFALSIPQSETERILEERLFALGIRVDRNVELGSLAAAAESVSCVLRRRDGSEEKTEVDWLVGCDGAHSTIRKDLGLKFRGDTIPYDFALADLHVAGLDVPPDELAIFFHGDGMVLFIPIKGDRYRIIADLGPSTGGSRVDPTIEEVQAIVDRRVGGPVKLSRPIWLAAFGINERKVDSYRQGRVFVAGDAAHIHSPAGGQGMNTGMQDAFNLAWKLALVVQQKAKPAILDSYTEDRSPVAKQVLADSGRLTSIAMTKNPVLQQLRNLVAHHVLGFPAARHAMAERLSETFFGYPKSPLNSGSAAGLNGPAPGDRIVDEKPFGSGNAPRFALMATDESAAKIMTEKYPSLVEASLRTPPDEKGIWLVRPDGYVAAVAHDGDWKTIEAALSRIAL
jgi:2-polyprenyl-6-methoxyphenol hydroxylase-like FAD-dependent oxidoreductase